MRNVILTANLAVAILFCGLPALAAEGVKIGEKMPDFSLKDQTGKVHSLSDYQGKVVVLEFNSKNCPWSRAVDPDISKLAGKYGAEVVFLGIDSDRDNTPEDIAKHIDTAGISFPILKDENNDYADKVAASRTPEIYIVNAEGTLVYHGAYDDRRVPEQSGETNYVAKALDEIKAGKEVSEPKVSAWGCAIKRVDKS